MMDMIVYYIVMLVLVLAIVIFVHEMGHFAMAKYFRVPTPVFSVGFGREIIGFTDRWGTRWKVSLFPVGGYVSIAGNETDPLLQRAWIAVAGPLGNFVFAILLMMGAYLYFGTPATPATVVGINITGGAFEAGIQPNDKLITLGNQPVPRDIDEIKRFMEAVNSPYLDVMIERQGQRSHVQVPVRPMNKTDDFGGKYQQKMLGVVFAGQNLKLSAIHRVAGVDTDAKVTRVRDELIRNFGKTVVINFGKGDDREDYVVHVDANLNKGLLNPSSTDYTKLVLWDDWLVEFDRMTLGRIVRDSFDIVYQGCKKTLGVIYQIVVGKKNSDDLGGVVAISTMTGDISQKIDQTGFFYFLKFIAVLSVNIGFINLLPLPMLDGGHLVFHAMEAVRGEPPSPKVRGYIYGIGIMFIIFVSLMVNFHDIVEKLSHT